MSDYYVPTGGTVSKPTEAEQLKELSQARKATRSTFDKRPITTQNEFIYRIFAVEKPALENMIAKGYPIKEILYYWSDSSCEAHAFPIFASDTPNDIVNRYSDFFPEELKLFANEMKEQNKILNNSNGMSDDGTMAVKIRCPIGLYRALVAFDADFWRNKRAVASFRRRFSQLVAVGRPK